MHLETATKTTRITPRTPGPRRPLRAGVFAIAALVIVAVLFSPALGAPFAFDDEASIVHNSTIQDPSHIWRALSPPGGGAPVSGRPIANLSFAVNYAINRAIGLSSSDVATSTDEAISYRVLNMVLHACVGLLLFGIVRRTLQSPRAPPDLSDRADLLAAIIGVVFLVHPIQTEAVDYVSQRTELLASFCYLGVLYASIRAWRARSVEWSIATVVISAIGMACKEVMVTVPFAVALYDRAFYLENWHDAIARSDDRPRRVWLYVGLLATSFIAVALVLAGGRGETVSLTGAVRAPAYAYSQGWAIWRYLGLLVWPAWLTFDYGLQPIGGVAAAIGLVAIAAILIAIVIAWTKPRFQWIAFLGTWFFLLIAPSSSIVPIQTEIAAERRVYLAVAAPISLVVICGWLLLLRRSPAVRRGDIPKFAIGAVALIVLALGVTTFDRSAMYRSPELLWEDATQKMPHNARAFDNLAALDLTATPPRIAHAETLIRHSIELDSTNVRPWTRLAGIAIHADRLGDAERLLRHALSLAPRDSEAADKMGQVFLASGRPDSAANYLERVAARAPTSESLTNLGTAYLESNRFIESARVLERAVQLDSSNTRAVVLLGATLVELDSGTRAVAVLERAVKSEANQAFDVAILSLAYAEAGDAKRASDAAALAAQLSPKDASVFVFCGRAMLRAGQSAVGEQYLARAVQIAPNNPQAVTWYAIARAAIGDRIGASAVLRRVLDAMPDYRLAIRARDSLRLSDKP